MKFGKFNEFCKIINISQVVTLIFLVILIGLCFAGLMVDNKYSCDNGVFINVNKLGELPDDTDYINNIRICLANENTKEVTECLSNKFDCVDCISTNKNIILIVIISLLGLLFLFKFGCMTLKSSNPLTAM
tara:strand:+ start:989 stop:1381 length:393 start_codon:yes stop_codon:yes gene_type:complete